MNELNIGKRFRLLCPEGFREMSEQERGALNMMGQGDTLCLTNEEGHMVVSMGWKDVNAVSAFLLRIIRPVTSVEASVNQAMAPYGYRKETGLTRQIGGQDAQGFRFTYTAGVPMVGESYVIREGRSLTFFHVYVRAAQRSEGLAQWNRLLDAVEPL